MPQCRRASRTCLKSHSSCARLRKGLRARRCVGGWDQRSDVLRLAQEVRGLMPSEMKRLKQLEEENSRLKRNVADLSLDKEMLQDVIRRKI